MMLILGLFSISYLLFVFISGLLNPFMAAKTQIKKPHLDLGRATAFASLASGVLAIGLLGLGMEDRLALAMYLLLTALLLIPSLVRFRRSRLWL